MLVMIDLEGTLTDNSARLEILLSTTKSDRKDLESWKKYYAGLIDDPPHHDLMVMLRKWIQAKFRVIVYSTRFANKYRHEEGWLRGHELWDHVELLQRDRTETKIEGPALVTQWVKEFQPEVVIDDRPEVRERLRGLVPGMIVASKDDFDTEAPATVNGAPYICVFVNEENSMAKEGFVDSTSDERLVNNVVPPTPEKNNVMRHAYRVLNDEQKAQMQSIKDRCLDLWEYIDSIGNSRELSLAKTAVEDACMRTVRHITA